jgi:hypothetical protein
VVALVAAAVLAPWAHPLAFRPLRGWRRGASGTVRSHYGGATRRVAAPRASSAWIAKNVRYRDRATADPPNATLAHLPRNGIVVWAVIFEPAHVGEKWLRLDLDRARRLPCCDGAYVAGGDLELTGLGRRGAYSGIVRVYFGSPPTRALRLEAQRALNRLELPPPRSR